MAIEKHKEIQIKHTLGNRLSWVTIFSVLLWFVYFLDQSTWIGFVALIVTALLLSFFIFGTTQISIHDGRLTKTKFFNMFSSSVDLRTLKSVRLDVAFFVGSGANYQKLVLADQSGSNVSFLFSYYYRTWQKQDELLTIIDKHGQASNATYNESALHKIRQGKLADSKYQITPSFEKKLFIVLCILVPLILVTAVVISETQR